jgi:dTMP kinase
MPDSNGAFIAIEGSDGSGKTTQFGLLKQRLEDAGYQTAVFKFPQYNQSSSHFIKQYLNGAYGPASAVNPYTASLFYALDRYEAAPLIRQALADGKIVLADRYAGSNMAHQGAKFTNPAERRGFFVWAESIEFQMLGIPRPNINLFLRVPAEKSFELTKARAPRDYTNQVQDEHEKDLKHLQSTVETYDMLCQLFTVDFKAIECLKNGELMSVEEIHALVWWATQPLLPAISRKSDTVEKVKKQAKLSKQVSRDKVIPISDTADKLAWQIDGISLITAYGLQQAGLGVEINHSNSWAGQGTAYKYSTPDGLNESVRQDYKTAYEQVIELHKKLNEKVAVLSPALKRITKEQLRLATPMGAIFSATLRLDKSQAGSVLEKLRTHPNSEIAALQGSLAFVLDQKTIPATRNSTQSNPQSVNDILEKISTARPDYGADLDALRIIDFNPRNEFELIADSVYSSSSLTREEIMLALDKLTYDQKVGELKKALSIEAVLQLPTYRFDALTDWLTLSELTGGKLAEIINVQQLTPRYGYDVPAQIEANGMEDQYMEIFDLFLSLFSQLQLEHDNGITQYATLAGNKIRWQGRISAVSLKSAAGIKDERAAAFMKRLLTRIKSVHPLTADFIVPSAKRPAGSRQRKSSSRKK